MMVQRKSRSRSIGPIALVVVLAVVLITWPILALAGSPLDPDKIPAPASVGIYTLEQEQPIPDNSMPYTQGTPLPGSVTDNDYPPNPENAVPAPEAAPQQPPAPIPTAPPVSEPAPASFPPSGGGSSPVTYTPGGPPLQGSVTVYANPGNSPPQRPLDPYLQAADVYLSTPAAKKALDLAQHGFVKAGVEIVKSQVHVPPPLEPAFDDALTNFFESIMNQNQVHF